jgi:hypothetical protein
MTLLKYVKIINFQSDITELHGFLQQICFDSILRLASDLEKQVLLLQKEAFSSKPNPSELITRGKFNLAGISSMKKI